MSSNGVLAARLVIGAIAFGAVAHGCGAPNYLAGNGGSRRPLDGAEGRIRDEIRSHFKDRIENEEEAETVAASASRVVSELFGTSYNPDLPDLIVYFDGQQIPKAPVLVSRGHAVQVLDREAVVWVIVLAEPAPRGECASFRAHFTTLAATKPDVALGINDFLVSILSRKSQDFAAGDPKEGIIPTEHVDPRNAKGLCWGFQRFAMPKDSFERMTVQPLPLKAKTQAAHTGASVGDGDTTIGSTIADGSAVADGGAAAAGNGLPKEHEAAAAGAGEYAAAALLNFANARTPRYGASVAIGSDIYSLTQRASCMRAAGCMPTIYVFGHLWDFPIPYNPRWNPFPKISIAPVVGLRVLNPVLGEAVGGLRVGFEEGLSRGLSRFGVVVGVGYAFRSFDTSSTVKTTTTDTIVGNVETKTVTTEQQAAGNQWHLFGGMDFAF